MTWTIAHSLLPKQNVKSSYLPDYTSSEQHELTWNIITK